MITTVLEQLQAELREIEEAGLTKRERIIKSPQSSQIEVGDGQQVLNFCANNYLGLANHPALVEAAKKALDDRGFGMASVRFICGTQDIHKQLEARVAEFLGMEDSILYAACFDANGGLFETLLGPDDAVISDELNHASIIDGIRLCKAKRFREAMTAAGFDIRPGVHPIVPIMLGDARLSVEMADALLKQGIYVIGFSYPVVPKGKARIRVQLSAGHSPGDVERAIEAFTKVGKDLGVVS